MIYRRGVKAVPNPVFQVENPEFDPLGVRKLKLLISPVTTIYLSIHQCHDDPSGARIPDTGTA
jgi:hypothetical protein